MQKVPCTPVLLLDYTTSVLQVTKSFSIVLRFSLPPSRMTIVCGLRESEGDLRQYACPTSWDCMDCTDQTWQLLPRPTYPVTRYLSAEKTDAPKVLAVAPRIMTGQGHLSDAVQPHASL